VSTRPRAEEHPFFRAMVLMGSSLAVGCGGAVRDTGDGSKSAGGAADTGSGGHTASAGHTASGGYAAAGGGESGGSPAVMGPACPSQQWACSALDRCEDGLSFSAASAKACTCDESLPITVTDCARGQVLACKAFTRDENGKDFVPPVPFDCRCVEQLGDCQSTCVSTFGIMAGGQTTCTDGFSDQYLCGCAYITLR
jgi:hypothetical protein